MEDNGRSNGHSEVKGDLEVFEKAICLMGGQIKMAEVLGRTQASISKIKTGKQSITIELAIKIQNATEDQILASDLRPDYKDQIQRAR